MARDHDKWRELTYEVGYALVDAVGEGWRRIDLRCRATVDVRDFTLTVLMADGSTPAVDLPDAAVQAIMGIREAYHEPESGTWFSMRYLLDPPNHIQSIYNLDWDPGWSQPFDPRGWVRDLAAFPRDNDHIRPWLRERLAEAGQQPTGVQIVRNPGDPLDPQEQQELWSDISNLIALSVPVDWAEVLLTYRAIGDYAELPVMVRRVTDGNLYRWEPPTQVRETLERLRAGMHRDGRGTWFQAAATVHLTSSVDFSYTWDDQPTWDGEPPLSAYAREVTRHPRDERRLPGWLATRLGAPGAAMLTASADPTTAAVAALRDAEEAAAELGLDPTRYRIGAVADGAWCLVAEDDRWAVFLACGAERLDRAVFDTARQAVRYFVGNLYLHRAAFTDELPPDAKRLTNQWPIQPMGGDVGLQVYGGKRIVTLPPGTEMDRHGTPEGNTLYAARTEWTHRSEPPRRREYPYHLYRLRRSVRGIVGTAVPWYDEAGGGTVYVLERSVADLLADGSIEEITQATTTPPPPPARS